MTIMSTSSARLKAAIGAVEPTKRKEGTAGCRARWARSFLGRACASASHPALPGRHPMSSARLLGSYGRPLRANPARYPPAQGSPAHHRLVVLAPATRAKYTTRFECRLLRENAGASQLGFARSSAVRSARYIVGSRPNSALPTARSHQHSRLLAITRQRW